MKQVWHTIEQFHILEQGDRILLGVSGGPDSMALLHLLNCCREQYDVQLFVVHVNHQLRPEAATEAAYVQDMCNQWEIPFRLFSVDVTTYAEEHGMSLEQAGHEVRYACFRQAAREWQINKLAVGHHRDDRAESLLLHLIQGCGLDGLTAMPPKDLWNNDSVNTDLEDDQPRWIIRPLAQVGKQELIQYCDVHQLHYFVDSTNLEPGCLRNQIRLELLPQFRQYNPKITDALLRLQDSCAVDADYLQQHTEVIWKQYGMITGDNVKFPADILREQHPAIQRRLLRAMYQALTCTIADLTYRQMEQMLHIALQQHGSQQMDLADSVIFAREYDILLMRRTMSGKIPNKIQNKTQTKTQKRTWEASTQHYVLYCEPVTEPTVWRDSRSASNWEIFVDADQLSDNLIIRTRQAGDRLRMPYGHKKLKEFFIDKKIPASQRDQIPLILSKGSQGEEIIWIPGYYTAHCVKITDSTARAYRLRCQIVD